MNDNEFKKFLGDSMILNYLIELYTGIAGISNGYVSAIMNERHISREKAERYVLKLDEMARNRVAEAYKDFEKMKDGEAP